MNVTSRAVQNQLLALEMERLRKAIETQEELTLPSAHQVGDEGDHALNDADRDKHKAVVDHLRQLLSQVESARARLAAGTYGICTDCGCPIPPERLEALPYATLCVSCQSKRDRAKNKRFGLQMLAQR